MVYVATFVGRRYESPVVCTGFAENKQLVTATTGGPFHLEVDQMLEPAGAGTELIVRCRADSRGFQACRAAGHPADQKHAETAGENLEALLEEHSL